MSAYVVDDLTVNRILAGVRESRKRNWNSNLPYVEGTLSDLPDLATLGEKMLSMNRRAVNYRYDEKNARIPFNYRAIPVPDHFQLLKSLRCFLYQCSEGKVPNMKLYKELEKYAGDLAYEIVSKLPAYEKSDWN